MGTSATPPSGFIYSADGRTIDQGKAREGDTLTFDALVTEFPPKRPGNVMLPSEARAVRFLDRDTLQLMMKRPLAPFILLALGDTVTRDVVKPARIPPPSISEGPHQSYAYQWFAFATVALVGFVAVARTDKRREEQQRLGH
jgi:surfeit locus 1 family protein